MEARKKVRVKAVRGPLITYNVSYDKMPYLPNDTVPLSFKGSVSRDFRPPVFFMIQTHLGP